MEVIYIMDVWSIDLSTLIVIEHGWFGADPTQRGLSQDPRVRPVWKKLSTAKVTYDECLWASCYKLFKDVSHPR